MSSDDAITEEGHAGKSHSTTHIKESIDWKTGGLDLRKTGFSGSFYDFAASPSSRKAKEQDHGEIAVGSSAGKEKSPCVEKENNTRKIHQDTFHLWSIFITTSLCHLQLSQYHLHRTRAELSIPGVLYTHR